MRLDKFLKVSRIIKRRTVAKEISDSGHIKVNDRTAKSSTKLSIGDILEINYANKLLTLKVESLKENAKKDEAASLYSIIEEAYK
ncbi:MAG: RNA-binding S4 domain-containing protein [Bacillota bacterium]